MNFKVTILGSNSATPMIERNPTAQVIHHAGRLFLMDCGEGTQIQLARYRIKIQKINHIFISHLHGDHYFGLIGLIMTYHLYGRQHPLHIYANPELKEILDLQVKASNSILTYELIFHPIDADKYARIYCDEQLEVFTIPMNHRVPTCGFLFRELKPERNLRQGVVQQYRIPVEAIAGIKSGEDFTDNQGHVIPNHMLTLPPVPPRVYACCSDTAYDEAIIPSVCSADLLYHEATFMHAKVLSAHEKYHSTTREAATIAKHAKVKKLIIGHYSARYEELEPLLNEAREVFPETYLAYEGAVFPIGETVVKSEPDTEFPQDGAQ